MGHRCPMRSRANLLAADCSNGACGRAVMAAGRHPRGAVRRRPRGKVHVVNEYQQTVGASDQTSREWQKSTNRFSFIECGGASTPSAGAERPDARSATSSFSLVLNPKTDGLRWARRCRAMKADVVGEFGIVAARISQPPTTGDPQRAGAGAAVNRPCG